MLTGKKILLGITGSIAAYKAILIIRLFVKAGAEVKVVLTPAAKDFVSPLTLSTLSKNKVLINLADEDTWANHVALGRWADVMLIAPLSCNSLAKMASGLCDNLLLAAYLSATCPVVVAPAMDEDMWKHSSIQNNLDKLRQTGNSIISVNTGELASGLFGEGRMADPEAIVTFIEEHFFRLTTFKGVKALVTAGPTYEAVDPVRFIGNHSSGKMGYALAEELYLQGADVNLVTGPSSLSIKYQGINVQKVNTAAEMYDSCMAIFPQVDIAIMAAAVADYSVPDVAAEKIKKHEDGLNLYLVKTRDILKKLGEMKNENQYLVGFALETFNEKNNALKKLRNKNADLIVLNSLKDEAAGFGKPTNKVTIFDREENEYTYEAKSKILVAKDIIDLIYKKYPWDKCS
jgi:phosphopantothenoylcysteine decarboxylase/phosphopantothenate--cysteine ligase